MRVTGAIQTHHNEHDVDLVLLDMDVHVCACACAQVALLHGELHQRAVDHALALSALRSTVSVHETHLG